MKWILIVAVTVGLAAVSPFVAGQGPEMPPAAMHGIMVDLGGHKLHFDCTGRGSPTIIIENGSDEFSFDWVFVQQPLSKAHRVCTYDRAGYAWSGPGPKPRSFDQMNLELHDSLAKLGENGPFIVVGHGFGGPLARNYAMRYPEQVAGLIFVDAFTEDDRFDMWKRAVLMRDGAKGRPIPAPREKMTSEDYVEVAAYYRAAQAIKIDQPFERLPRDIQKLHVWAEGQKSLAAAEENEREWSPEYFARWHANPVAARLGSIPLIVLTRTDAGFPDLDITAAQWGASGGSLSRDSLGYQNIPSSDLWMRRAPLRSSGQKRLSRRLNP